MEPNILSWTQMHGSKKSLGLCNLFLLSKDLYRLKGVSLGRKYVQSQIKGGSATEKSLHITTMTSYNLVDTFSERTYVFYSSRVSSSRPSIVGVFFLLLTDPKKCEALFSSVQLKICKKEENTTFSQNSSSGRENLLEYPHPVK